MSTKNKPVIAVDFDEVLSDMNDAMRRFANKTYGHAHTTADFSVKGEFWSYWNKIWNISDEEGNERINAYHDADGTMLQMPLPNIVAVLKHLKKNYRLVIVTGRDDEHVEITERWLAKHIPEVFEEIRFVNLANGENKKATKADVCKELGAKYLIDDHIVHCQHVAEVGVIALLFGDYGWNRDAKLPKNVHRVKDWQR